MKIIEQLQEQIKGLPDWQKWLLPVLFSLFILAGYYYLVHQPQASQIGELERKLGNIQEELIKSRKLAARLPAFKAQLKELGFQLAALVNKLPDDKEIPELLVQISGLGMQTGLEFTLFKPTGEQRKDFYAEIPVEIEVFGGYHQVARFFDRISKLPRIVNITNLSMGDPKMVQGQVVLKTRCMTTTYRSLESQDGSAQEVKPSE